MRLTDKYRPRRLTEVVGQAAARVLEKFCRRPYRSCWLLEGPPGTGKSASAHAVAEELRCTTLSKHPIPANKLNVELAQGLFDAWTRFLPMDGAAFHVVIIEEFERVVSQAYGYIRVSHEEQKESGLSLEAQEQQCRRFWERQLKPIGVTWANFMADEAVSAFKRALFRRPQGQLLLVNLHRGDHLIITRFDRVFRSMEDFVTAYKLLETRGVMIHILDAPGNPNTANGRAMLQMLCVFAEWSSRITSERNQAVVAILRQQNRPVSGTPPWGFQIVGPQGARRLEPDWEARAMMERIVCMHDLEGQGWATIAQRIRADQAAARRHQLGESLRLEAHPAKARARNARALRPRVVARNVCPGGPGLLANPPDRGAGLDPRHRSPPPCRVPGQQAVDPNRPAVKLDRFDFCHEAPVRRKGVGLLHGVHHARLSGRF